MIDQGVIRQAFGDPADALRAVPGSRGRVVFQRALNAPRDDAAWFVVPMDLGIFGAVVLMLVLAAQRVERPARVEIVGVPVDSDPYSQGATHAPPPAALPPSAPPSASARAGNSKRTATPETPVTGVVRAAGRPEQPLYVPEAAPSPAPVARGNPLLVRSPVTARVERDGDLSGNPVGPALIERHTGGTSTSGSGTVARRLDDDQGGDGGDSDGVLRGRGASGADGTSSANVARRGSIPGSDGSRSDTHPSVRFRNLDDLLASVSLISAGGAGAGGADVTLAAGRVSSVWPAVAREARGWQIYVGGARVCIYQTSTTETLCATRTGGGFAVEVGRGDNQASVYRSMDRALEKIAEVLQ